MKTANKILLLLFALGATVAHAQTNLYPQVQHVIVVIQENRTPDNLFNEDSTLIANGGHVQPNLANEPPNYGACYTSGNKKENYIPLQANPFYTCYDPDHSHARGQGAWMTTWHNGAMDGACSEYIQWQGSKYCGGTQPLCDTNGPNGSSTCPYTYVDNKLWDSQHRILDPYFQIANQYG